MRTYTVLYVPFVPESLKRTARSTWEGGIGSQISDDISLRPYSVRFRFFPAKKKEMPIGSITHDSDHTALKCSVKYSNTHRIAS